jgi:hypothetical protein
LNNIVHAYILKKYATYLSSCMVPDIISLVAKKVRYAYEYI